MFFKPRGRPLPALVVASWLAVSSAPAGQAQSAAEWRLQTVQYQIGRSYLGVGVTDVDPDRAGVLGLGDRRGVEIRSLQNGSPAEESGLQIGDVLLTYNGEEILSSRQLGRLVSETPPGRKVKLGYWHAGKHNSTLVKLAAPPVTANDASSQLGGFQALGAADIPRMLMLWDNLTLGIECEPIDAQLARYFGVSSGILIRQVAHGMSADRAGLKAGDVITSIDTRSIASPRDLISYLRTGGQQNKQISLSVVRDRKPRSFTVNIVE